MCHNRSPETERQVRPSAAPRRVIIAGPRNKTLKELLRTNDVVLLSFLEARLKGEGIEPFILDMNASIVEGSIGILPRRLMVIDEDFERAEVIAKMALKESDEAIQDEPGAAG
jgi:Putative prokaryotic signal transducing protein